MCYNIFIKYDGGAILEDKSFSEAMELIVSALKERGYDPYSQIYGYLKENEPAYITNHNGARDLIQKLDLEQIRNYLTNMERIIK